MKKLNIELSEKSIQNAIRELKRIQGIVQKNELIKEFTEYICEWIISKANFYLESSDIGELVKLQIRNAWTYTVGKDGAKIINTADKAVFVEFGVGIVGQGNPHPNASIEGYTYNIPTTSKDDDGMWYFWSNSNELDIPTKAIVDMRGYDDFRGKGKESGKRIVVGTRGTYGVMYAYNALVDARNSLKNGELAKKWNEIVERYIG